MRKKIHALTIAAMVATSLLTTLQVSRASAAPDSTPILDRLVSLQADSVTAADLSASLSRSLGVTVEVRLPKDSDTLSMHIVDTPMREVLAALGNYGTVLVAGEEVTASPRVRTADPLGRVVSLNVKSADAALVVNQLAGFTGLDMTFAAAQGDGRVSLDVKGATVREILQMLARLGTLEVAGEPFASTP